jgi:hypothetical protein
MTIEDSQTKLINCLQQELYKGKSGAPPAGGGDTATNEKPSGWWAFQYDPATPTQLTMLVTLTKEQTDPTESNPGTDGGDCLAFYSNRLSVDEVQSLYQWLALQMGQQMSNAGS